MHALIMRATNEWSWNSITMLMRLRCGLSDIFCALDILISTLFPVFNTWSESSSYKVLVPNSPKTCDLLGKHWIENIGFFFLTLILRWKSLFLSISDLVVTEDCAHMKTRSIKDLRALHIGSQLFKGTATRRFSPFRLVMPNDTL